MWEIEFFDDFDPEFDGLSKAVQDALLTKLEILEERGPTAGRPLIDTLNGSKHANMKELRFNADNGVWRAALAFDPARKGVVLVAADKSGVSEKRFYQKLIAVADARFDKHLAAAEAL
jgi:hypothetical protein